MFQLVQARRGVMSGFGGLFVCFVEDARATLPPQSRFLVDQRRLTQFESVLSAESQENAEGCTPLFEDVSSGLVWFHSGRRRSDNLKKSHNKQQQQQKKSAIYQVCSAHLHGMQLLSFRMIAQAKAKKKYPENRTYGFGEFCRSGTKVDDLFVLHVQISVVLSV